MGQKMQFCICAPHHALTSAPCLLLPPSERASSASEHLSPGATEQWHPGSRPARGSSTQDTLDLALAVVLGSLQAWLTLDCGHSTVFQRWPPTWTVTSQVSLCPSERLLWGGGLQALAHLREVYQLCLAFPSALASLSFLQPLVQNP